MNKWLYGVSAPGAAVVPGSGAGAALRGAHLVQEGLDGRGAPVAKALRQRAAHAAEEVVVLRSGWVELAGAGPRLGRLGGTRPGVDSLLPRRSSHQVVLEGAQVDEAKCGEDAIALRAVRGGCKFRHAPE